MALNDFDVCSEIANCGMTFLATFAEVNIMALISSDMVSNASRGLSLVADTVLTFSPVATL